MAEIEIGRRKAAYRIRLMDVETGKSLMSSIYQRGRKKSLSELMAKVIDAFREG